MEFLSSIKALVPDYAKDIRLNLDGTIARSSLERNDAVGVALAAAFAAKSTVIVNAIRNAGRALARRDERRVDRRRVDGHEQRLVSVRRDGGQRGSEDRNRPSCA